MSDEELPYVKVHVDLHGQEDTPVAVETLWAVATSDSNYRIDNIPFYAKGICDGDIVKCQNVEGALWFVSVVQPSSNSVIRVVWNHRQTKESRSWLRARLVERGCTVEIDNTFNRLAVSIPEGIKVSSVLSFLKFGVDRGLIWIEEAAIRAS